MKYEPAFKPLQGNPAFFWVRASRGPFHLRQKTQIPSHIHISEGRLLLICLWKVGLPLQSKSGNHIYPEIIWSARNIPQVALLKLMILYTWEGCLRESLDVPKGSQATCLYDVDRGVVMEPMQGKLASFQFDFGYTEQFCIPGVTLVFFSSCNSVVGDSLEFNQANRGSLDVWLGKPNCSGHSAGESGLILRQEESLMGYLLLLQEPGVCSRLTAGMSIRNCSLFSEVKTPL